jgi:predicted nuclease with TOPRIM domain
MRDIKEIFEKIQEHRREQRELNASIKDSLRNMPEYHDLSDQISRLQLKRAQLENSVTEHVGQKIDLLKLNIKEGMQTMSDIALTTLMKGESVILKDAKDNEYEPIFSVRFKKANRSYEDAKPPAQK